MTNIFELNSYYINIVKAGFKPILITNNEVWNISPVAVRDLKFREKSISFSCLVEGEPKLVVIDLNEVQHIAAECGEY